MEPKRMHKVAIFLVFWACCVVLGLRFFLPDMSQKSKQKRSFSPVKRKPHVKLMTQENNPALFRKTFCDFQGISSPTQEWQERTPYFLLAGAKKCATTSLARYLKQHDRLVMAKRKELLYFLPNNFRHINTTTGKTLVEASRQTMWLQDYNTTLLQQNSSLLAFEATPGYIFHSTTSPKFILCTAPWVKILLILRNPVDRAWSNYNFYLTSGVKLPSFETWIDRDFNLLKETGMLPNEEKNNRHSSSFVGSSQEYIAWDLYLKKCNEGPVGRSMYVVQILHWYKAMQAVGRDPTKDILIVRNEDLKVNPQATLDKIYNWLGVESQPFQPEAKEFMVSKYEAGTMSNKTKKMLEDFYRPYNQRLYDLLGGGDWQDVWEQPFNKTTTTGSTYHYSNTSQYVGGGRQNHIANNKPGKYKKTKRGPLQTAAWYKKAKVNDDESIVNVEDPYIYGKPSYNETAAAAFSSKWCELEGMSLYPKSNRNAWQLRAPYVLIPGAKKSGTTSLAFYLMQHPKVARARTKELQFFLNKNFRAEYVRDYDRRTLVKPARLAYERDFRKRQLQLDPSLISMDATPGYFFFSNILPQRILCVSPWVKLLIIMRNPVDRAYSNYQYVVWQSMGRFTQSFEKFIDFDLRALRKAGILTENDEPVPLTMQQEDEAWYKYLGLAKEGPIGRSLYVIQLRQWSQAIRDVGRDPDSQIHLVRTEDIRKDLDGEYRKVQEFLGLEYSPIQSPEPKVVNKYEPMRNETRAMLEKLFAPYNKRLYDMLGGDWEGYWDP